MCVQVLTGSSNAATGIASGTCATGQLTKPEALNINIFGAVLASLRGMVDAKANFVGQDDVKQALVSAILGMLCWLHCLFTYSVLSEKG